MLWHLQTISKNFWAVFVELSRSLYVFETVLFECFFATLLYRFVFCDLLKTVGRGLVAYSINRSVAFSFFCAREV